MDRLQYHAKYQHYSDNCFLGLARDQMAPTVKVAVLLLPAYSQMVHMLLSELLRIAGLAGATQFTVINCSPGPVAVRASNNRQAEIDADFLDLEHPDAVVVCASYEPYDHLHPPVLVRLRRAARHGALIGGIDTGSILLAEAGLLDGRRATLHWDELAQARRMYPDVAFTSTIVEKDRRLLTGCGSLGTIEFALELISHFAGEAVLRDVEDLTIHGRHEARFAASNAALSKAIHIMQDTIDRPLPLHDIARLSGTSIRQLARNFETELGTSPGRHYLNLRLEHARELVTKTRFSLTEISYASGFNSPSWFSRAFRSKFGFSPGALRKPKPVRPG